MLSRPIECVGELLGETKNISTNQGKGRRRELTVQRFKASNVGELSAAVQGSKNASCKVAIAKEGFAEFAREIKPLVCSSRV